MGRSRGGLAGGGPRQGRPGAGRAKAAWREVARLGYASPAQGRPGELVRGAAHAEERNDPGPSEEKDPGPAGIALLCQPRPGIPAWLLHVGLAGVE
jgi:hypothetical protein